MRAFLSLRGRQPKRPATRPGQSSSSALTAAGHELAPHELLASPQAAVRAKTTPAFIEVPEIDFLRIDGHGDPNTSPTYAAAIQALYSVSYTAKFAIKKAGGEQFKVSALEGLWWSRDLSAFGGGDKSDWDWRMMIPPALQRDRRYVRAVRRRGRDEEGAPCRP